MTELYQSLQLTEAQTEVFCRGLLDLAAVDGLHENEIALVRDFFTGSGGDAAQLEAMAADGFDPNAAAAVLDADTTQAFLMSCYMLIYADGKHSDQERARIGEYAAALGVSEADLEQIHTLTRSFLLQNLAAGLRNQEAVADVGSELGLGDEMIKNLIEKEG